MSHFRWRVYNWCRTLGEEITAFVTFYPQLRVHNWHQNAIMSHHGEITTDVTLLVKSLQLMSHFRLKSLQLMSYFRLKSLQLMSHFRWKAYNWRHTLGEKLLTDITLKVKSLQLMSHFRLKSLQLISHLLSVDSLQLMPHFSKAASRSSRFSAWWVKSSAIMSRIQSRQPSVERDRITVTSCFIVSLCPPFALDRSWKYQPQTSHLSVIANTAAE